MDFGDVLVLDDQGSVLKLIADDAGLIDRIVHAIENGITFHAQDFAVFLTRHNANLAAVGEILESENAGTPSPPSFENGIQVLDIRETIAFSAALGFPSGAWFMVRVPKTYDRGQPWAKHPAPRRVALDGYSRPSAIRTVVYEHFRQIWELT